jgi:hypothetical protein
MTPDSTVRFKGFDLRDSGVSWMTTDEAGRFLAAAEPFLRSDPVANNGLLTEARFWMWLSDPAPGARFGWWADGSGIGGAFVEIPGHVPVCSPLSAPAIALLPGELAHASSLGVQAQDAAAVTEAWRTQGRVLSPTVRMTLLRLGSVRAPAPPVGAPRVADATDLSLLRSWFELFQRGQPDDPSQVEFVVDHPLDEGGVIVWEVHGHPVAMASRTPTVAGMTRLGLAFQPTEGTTYSDAAFIAACLQAARTAEHVLLLSGTRRSTAAYRSLGFTPVVDRVVLGVLDAQSS